MRVAYNKKLKEVNDMEKKYEFNYFLTEKLYDVTDSIEGSLGSEDINMDEVQLEEEKRF
jgi:hypothetical protein